jgi:hypothetical protein
MRFSLLVLRCLALAALLLTAAGGCDNRLNQKAKAKPARRSPWEKKAGSKKIAAKTAPGQEMSDDEVPRRIARAPRRVVDDTSSSLDTHTTFAPATSSSTGAYLSTVVRESVEYGPTLVVWVIDRTDSAQPLRLDALGAMRSIYGGSLKDKPLKTVVVTYGQQVDQPLADPTADGSAVLQTMEKITRDESGREATFAALTAAGQRYLKHRTELKEEVLFILVTDEIGDDMAQAEAAISFFKKHVIPVYVLSIPAPFGKRHLGDVKAENGTADRPGVSFGPESREVEAVAIESLGGNYDLEVLDSGFGPFSLEWLARATDGKLLANRPSYHEGAFFGLPGSEWPTSRARQFDAQVIKKYTPDYVSAADYQALLDGNAAAKALVAAGKLPRAEVRTQLNLTFTKRSEAQFATELSKSQQGAAKLEPAIVRIYDTLVAGEGDRAKLTSPRWQAAFDVAMGRACAAKARIEGYNAMLALLKQGKAFERPESKVWHLETADHSDQASSAINKLVERSQTYLKRVVAEHPKTPWAIIAERELQEQLGWTWKEE